MVNGAKLSRYGSRGYMMPGLGNIVQVHWRYDHDREGGKGKAYFYGSLVGYILG